MNDHGCRFKEVQVSVSTDALTALPTTKVTATTHKAITICLQAGLLTSEGN